MSAFTDQLHMGTLEVLVSGFKDAPADTQALIEAASDAVADVVAAVAEGVVDTVAWLLDW